MNKILTVILLTIVVLVGGYFLMSLYYTRAEIGLRNRGEAQQDVCTFVYDETWKIINQQAQVAEEHKEAYREIFPELMEGRYGNERGGALLSFIQENNPEFDSSLFKQISASIEAQRHKFTDAQTMLADIKREHDDIREKPPGSHFVGDKPELQVQFVTSAKTEEVFQQGKEDDVNVF